MIRSLWIVGLSIALIVFSGFVTLCLVALVSHRHLNLTGWTMLVFGVIGLRSIFTGLRSAIRFGDPTIETDRQNSN
ncbi:MAG: hypothetical protein ACP5E2_07065 [Terracidiphilus sp.]